ncbi:MAG TPA: HAD family hydrolase [Saprospiraceae bacterium]|nr:HAD family hydrolase [Saprospiraceae bacterium]
MKKILTLLFDLDGTLIDSLHDKFAKYRDGLSDFHISELPVYNGAKELIQKLKDDGHQVLIVSDSHPKYVNKIANEIFKVECLSLAYKPAIDKIENFIKEKSLNKLETSRNRIFMIGDHAVDITTARKLCIPSVHIIHEINYNPEVWAFTQKVGPTFSCRNFDDLYNIINNPLENLLVLEGMEFSDKCRGVVSIGNVNFTSNQGKKTFNIALARQESGLCDIFAKSSLYYEFSSPSRETQKLEKIAFAVSNYIEFFMQRNNISFDILTFIPDKSTTIPPKKMESFADLIQTAFKKEKLLRWKDDVKGSIRNQPKRNERYSFVNKYLEAIPTIEITGKNIVVIDDQITTGATMDATSEILRSYGANNILSLSLFRMVDEVNIGLKCPKCGKDLSIRTRKSDGNKFYSCVPSQYGGVGCGHTDNIK